MRYAPALFVLFALTSSAWAQTAVRSEATNAAPRQFAPGVVQTIEPELGSEETVSTQDLIEIRADPELDWQPKFLAPTRTLQGMATSAKFRREVWSLEFAFKPMRMIEWESDRIWYLVYRVTNRGQAIAPVVQEDGTYRTEATQGGPVRFIPHFVLEGHDRTAAGGRVYKAYLDQVIPGAVELIRQRETPRRRLLTSVEIAELMLPVSDEETDGSVWGVAMWRDVDPRMDFFSVYVEGLTNAYRWIDPPGAYEPGDPPGTGRRFVHKALQLNFWRPGDEYLEHEGEFKFGVPIGKAYLYDVPEGVAYRWVYR